MNWPDPGISGYLDGRRPLAGHLWGWIDFGNTGGSARPIPPGGAGEFIRTDESETRRTTEETHMIGDP
jgi:hypothetical protein